jgi:hypothetical protein
VRGRPSWGVGAPAVQESGTALAASEATFTAEELEQVAAPIAL